MKPTYIENIKRACIAANPSLVELKFECEVEVIFERAEVANPNEFSEGREEARLKNNHRIDELNGFYKGICIGDRVIGQGVYVMNDLIKLGKSNWFKIIGREPTLADVLLAIGKFCKKTVDNNDAQTVAIDHTGKFARFTAFNNGGFDIRTIGSWNLKENLYNQSEETLLFINDLLV